MEVPMLDLQAQLELVGADIQAEVSEVIASGQYILGPKVEALEAALAEYVGAEEAIAVSSGTDALLVSLMALGIGPGDVVVTTPYSFFATAGVIARVGASPAFVDIDPDSYNIDPAALREWFAQGTDTQARTKAIMPVHLYGQCADMTPVLEIAADAKVPVIEDAAQAIGSAYPTDSGVKKAGSMGDFGCFSFYPTKNLSGIGEGGLVTTNDADLAARVRQLRNHGSRERYYHPVVGGNFRMAAVQAAALLVKLEHLEAWNAQRRENAAYYDAHLPSDAIKTPHLAYAREHHVYNQYVIRLAERRDACKEYLREHGIASEIFYPLPFHLQECFAGLGYGKGDFPQSELAAAQTLALPIYPELTTAMQDHVIETLTAFYE